MTKEELITKIQASKNNPATGRNSMGASESFYDKNFMVASAFTPEELEKMDTKELENLLKLAEFAAEVFY